MVKLAMGGWFGDRTHPLAIQVGIRYHWFEGMSWNDIQRPFVGLLRRAWGLWLKINEQPTTDNCIAPKLPEVWSVRISSLMSSYWFVAAKELIHSSVSCDSHQLNLFKENTKTCCFLLCGEPHECLYSFDEAPKRPHSKHSRDMF